MRRKNYFGIYLLFFTGILSLSAYSQGKTQFRGFADANVAVNLDGEPSPFFLGQYDSYVTSQVTDRVSFLGEVVFEYDQGWLLDVERVIMKYEWNSAFNVQFGKFHTPLGYWNNAFHHGGLLEPTITRPLSVKFEDEGGILPIHTSGISISGDNIGEKLNFGYDLMIGNGIGSTPMEDNDKNKSVTAQVRISPIEGVTIGASGYFDRISTGTVTLMPDTSLSGSTSHNITQMILAEDVQQRTLNGFIALEKKGLQVIAEYYNITNTSNSVTANTDGYFVYAGYTINKITPYVKYDVVQYDANDIYFHVNNKTLISGGLRYEMGFLSVLKVEYKYLVTETEGASNNVVVSWAVGF